MGEKLGLNGQTGDLPLLERFAEMDVFQCMAMARAGWPGHAVVLAPATVREEDTLVVPKLDRLARFVPDACARERLHGKQPKLSDRQQRELCRMHATGEYSISDLAELFSVSRPTVCRTLNRLRSP